MVGQDESFISKLEWILPCLLKMAKWYQSTGSCLANCGEEKVGLEAHKTH